MEKVKEPPIGLLMSMAMRLDHALGLPGYYDMFGPGEHEKKLRVAIADARRCWEEMNDQGFWSEDRNHIYEDLYNESKGEK